MPDELLPQNDGRVETPDGVFYSATAIAAMNITGLPKSRAGVYKKAERDGWPVIFQPGRGARDGVQFFKLPDQYKPNWITPIYKNDPVVPLMTGGSAKALFANDHPNADGAFIGIDQYVDVKGAAGPGQFVHEEAVVKVRVDARLLRERVGNNFSRIKIAAVSGDSMEPTLSHGDQVLIDTSCTHFVENAIYAIQQDGFLRFKRIKLKLDGSIIVKSDNPIDNEPETYTADEAQYFKVVGIVIPFKFGRFKL